MNYQAVLQGHACPKKFWRVDAYQRFDSCRTRCDSYLQRGREKRERRGKLIRKGGGHLSVQVALPPPLSGGRSARQGGGVLQLGVAAAGRSSDL